MGFKFDRRQDRAPGQRGKSLRPEPAERRDPEGRAAGPGAKIKFESYGEEMIQKVVRPSGSSGRVYLPPEWVGKNVRIIRLD